MTATYGEKVVRRERIDLGPQVCLFRKTWDNGFVEAYVRVFYTVDGGEWSLRAVLNEGDWEHAATNIAPVDVKDA